MGVVGHTTGAVDGVERSRVAHGVAVALNIGGGAHAAVIAAAAEPQVGVEGVTVLPQVAMGP